MSEIRDFKRDVIMFVQEIEKFPCIYNSTMPEYSNRAETKRAWTQIAENLASAEHEVKEKWRKIRIAFMRSLKQQYTNQTSKPYYLFENLKFLLPYVKFNDLEVEQGPSPIDSDYDHLEIRNHKVEMGESDDSIEKNDISDRNRTVFHTDTSRNEATNHTVFINERIAPTPDIMDSYKIQLAKKRKCETSIENNPRKMFLLSILPDVESFTDEEMRSFRRGVICTIDNIMEKRRAQ